MLRFGKILQALSWQQEVWLHFEVMHFLLPWGHLTNLQMQNLAAEISLLNATACYEAL